ncbi:Inositol-1-monophosphatase [Roseimaritima multifibrata]|uniref:Inositol-1-monophosphatase n=1 Tax=Roseimaritima multifibrata TaxID=1930274 RepID=A0A517MEJ9_9BACT|nr:inositol monophosphatase family protein [Roseimaritima multifibrata]QDS93303.1 Inositol-1-monophosphatase [Roseimaritima multifibrata]
MNDKSPLQTAVRAARAGAVELMQRWDHRLVREKGPKDLVTDADLASQKAVRDILMGAYPENAFVGEENGETQPPEAVRDGELGAPACWIVDPLDGTVNYVHQLQSFAVSIALFAEGKLQVGVVYDPTREEMFTAERGKGAFLNGQPFTASDCTKLNEALVACSFATSVPRDSVEIERFVRMLGECQSIRRLGSCALNLCYVAAGRLDGYWAASVKSWDAAAGALIALEAGAQIAGLEGEPFDVWEPKFVAAATPVLQQRMLKIFAD